MGKRTKEEIMQDTINIKFEPMNVGGGNLSFKCTNTDWSMVAFDIKRDMLEGANAKNVQFGDKELTYNCIYFLIGRVGVEERIYVGIAGIGVDGESVLRRLRQHCDKTSRYYREHWSRVVVATHKEIDKLDIKELQGLERYFYDRIPKEYRENRSTPPVALHDVEALMNKLAYKIRYIESYLAALRVEQFTGIDDGEKITVQSVTNDYSTVEDLQNGMARIPEIVTPQKVVKSVIDMLEKENPNIWNPETTFLDLACKGGEFLKELYNRLMETESLKALFPNEIARSNHILSKQLFGIALSEVSKKRTTDTLNGFGYNIKIIPQYISKLKHGLWERLQGDTEKLEELLTGNNYLQGTNKDSVCILTGIDRSGNLFAKPVCLGSIERYHVVKHFTDKFEPDAIMVTDHSNSYVWFAEESNLHHEQVLASKHTNGPYSLARINSVHSILSAYWSDTKENLPATKYLDIETHFFWWLQKNKDLTTQEKIDELLGYINEQEYTAKLEDWQGRPLQLDTKGLIPTKV